MRTGIIAVIITALALVFFTGCPDSGSNPGSPAASAADSSLVGTWKFAQKLTIDGNRIDTVNASDSVRGTYVFNADSTFTNTNNYTFGSNTTFSGTWSVKGDSLILGIVPPFPGKYTYAISSSTLILTNTDEIASVLFIHVEKYSRQH
jgi:hypothetical protein